MESSEFVTKVLWTVINHHSKLHFSEVTEKFKLATGHNISDYFEFDKDEI